MKKSILLVLNAWRSIHFLCGVFRGESLRNCIWPGPHRSFLSLSVRPHLSTPPCHRGPATFFAGLTSSLGENKNTLCDPCVCRALSVRASVCVNSASLLSVRRCVKLILQAMASAPRLVQGFLVLFLMHSKAKIKNYWNTQYNCR